MSEVEIAMFQFGTLVLVGSIGIAFSYILPKPKNAIKIASHSFARLFIVLMIISQCLIAIRHLAQFELTLYVHPVFALSAAYCVFLSVVTRTGDAVSNAMKFGIAVHLSVTAVVFAIAVYHGLSADVKTVIMVINSGIPVVFSLLHVVVQPSDNKNADKVLIRVLALMSFAILIVLPLLLFSTYENPINVTLFSFIATLAILLVFILGFSLNVVYALINKLQKQVTTDPLTSAKNRHFFHEVAPVIMSRLAREKKHLSLIVCDIDHFKRINDEFGHDCGDKALAHFARTLSKELRKEDILIRMGGEEFLVMSPAVDATQALPMAERIRKTIALTSFTTHGKTLLVTASFGVITMQADESLDDAIIKADEALYEAKKAGRNRVVAAK